MQKETEILNGTDTAEIGREEATVTKNDGLETGVAADAENTEKQETKTNFSNADSDFEELINGPYKDAFAKKVQGIINKRFKKQKQAEGKTENDTTSTAEVIQKGIAIAEEDPAYLNLLKAGVDAKTAYRVLHFDEFMDSSMRYGAELAAKQVADSIRQKAARPTESALSQKGFVAKASVTALTPQKRRELAQKALMGEEIEL